MISISVDFKKISNFIDFYLSSEIYTEKFWFLYDLYNISDFYDYMKYEFTMI